MLLLEQDTIRKEQVDNKALLELEKNWKFKTGGDQEYKAKAIIDNAIYKQQANNNQILGFYYLILWKCYPEEKNTWELLLAVIQF